MSGLARATYYEMIVVASNGKVEQASDKEEILTAGGVGKWNSVSGTVHYSGWECVGPGEQKQLIITWGTMCLDLPR